MSTPLRITDSRITVSKHRSGELFFHHDVKGILPGCRKIAILSTSPMACRIWVKNLYSYNGEANVRPQDWATLIRRSPVVSDRLFPVEITSDIAAQAYADVLQITDCPAVTDSACHPNYLAALQYDEVAR